MVDCFLLDLEKIILVQASFYNVVLVLRSRRLLVEAVNSYSVDSC
jgi:hypothetical protein